MKKLQLEDLSKKLGVSKTLISMVLNGKGNHYGISKKTQARVREAIAKLNYSPNKFAKSLRTGKSFFIGLIVTDISNPFYSTIAKNVENVLFENEYNLMVCSTDENEQKEKLLVEMMINQQGVDGLIIASTYKDADFYSQGIFAKIPIVFIDRVLPSFKANYVMINNHDSAYEIVQHLIKKGNHTIACFAITPLYLSTIGDRINGYRQALKKGKIKEQEHLIKPIRFDNIEADVEHRLTELLNEGVQLDAIFALNNHIAVAILSTLRKKEFESFSKIEIACFDDLDTFDIMDKKIVSVRQPVDEIGRSSSALLLDLVTGRRSAATSIVLPTTLMVR